MFNVVFAKTNNFICTSKVLNAKIRKNKKYRRQENVCNISLWVMGDDMSKQSIMQGNSLELV